MKKSRIIFAAPAFALLGLTSGNSNGQVGVKTSGQPQKKEQNEKKPLLHIATAFIICVLRLFTRAFQAKTMVRGKYA
jgi:hypothetical protein